MSASGSSSTAAPSTGAFAADDRVYFFKETATWRYEADDGTEMEYDAAKSAWVPVVSLCRLSRTGAHTEQWLAAR